MSWWDLVLVILMAAAIFQGYRRGFALRLAGWVGGVIALIASYGMALTFSPRINRIVDGESIIAHWIREQIKASYSSESFIRQSDLYKWVNNVVGLEGYKNTILDQVDKAGTDFYDQFVNAMSRVLAAPIWHLLLTIGFWLVLLFVFVVLGRLLHLGLLRVPLLVTIDAFLGAIVSAVMIIVVLAALDGALYIFAPENTFLGAAVHHSFFASFSRDLLGFINPF